jgi:hypothetical protein
MIPHFATTISPPILGHFPQFFIQVILHIYDNTPSFKDGNLLELWWIGALPIVELSGSEYTTSCFRTNSIGCTEGFQFR